MANSPFGVPIRHSLLAIDEAPPNRRAGGGGTADGFASLGMQWRGEPNGLVDALIVGRRLIPCSREIIPCSVAYGIRLQTIAFADVFETDLRKKRLNRRNSLHF